MYQKGHKETVFCLKQKGGKESEDGPEKVVKIAWREPKTTRCGVADLRTSSCSKGTSLVRTKGGSAEKEPHGNCLCLTLLSGI